MKIEVLSSDGEYTVWDDVAVRVGTADGTDLIPGGLTILSADEEFVEAMYAPGMWMYFKVLERGEDDAEQGSA